MGNISIWIASYVAMHKLAFTCQMFLLILAQLLVLKKIEVLDNKDIYFIS